MMTPSFPIYQGLVDKIEQEDLGDVQVAYLCGQLLEATMRHALTEQEYRTLVTRLGERYAQIKPQLDSLFEEADAVLA
jgi:hypothetical protein